MISSLTGTIQGAFQGSIIVDVGGVGYEVFMTERTLRSTDIQEGKQVFLFTHHHIRENASELYGFLSYNEKQMFLSLLSVSGIGPKVALSILHTASVDILVEAVSQQDHSILETIAGVGQKKAQKIICGVCPFV